MLQQQISNKNEKTGDFQPLSDTNIVIRYVTTKGMGNKLLPQKKMPQSHLRNRGIQRNTDKSNQRDKSSN